jgi:hypothetical protein
MSPSRACRRSSRFVQLPTGLSQDDNNGGRQRSLFLVLRLLTCITTVGRPSIHRITLQNSYQLTAVRSYLHFFMVCHWTFQQLLYKAKLQRITTSRIKNTLAPCIPSICIQEDLVLKAAARFSSNCSSSSSLLLFSTLNSLFFYPFLSILFCTKNSGAQLICGRIGN